MKRSEMLLLVKGLFDIAPNFPSETNAENLLGHLEEAGMLPPKRYRDMDWNEKDITYSQWIQLPSKINEWDKE